MSASTLGIQGASGAACLCVHGLPTKWGREAYSGVSVEAATEANQISPTGGEKAAAAWPVNENGETRNIGLRLLDRENPRANRLLVANQFIIQGDSGAVRADVVVFVNGLPLAVLELKSPTDAA